MMSQMLTPEPPTISRSSSSVSDITALSSSSLSLPLQKRKALLIGINYQYNEEIRLNKPINDVKAFSKFLLDQGYAPTNVITMTDDLPKDSPHMPTHDNIIRELENLIRGAMPDDHFLFLYSGHSVQVKQPAGKSPRELYDKDQAIVPVDGADEKGNTIFDKIILDDALNEILVKRLPSGSNLFAILDTCHSATLLDLYHRRCNLRELDPSFRIINSQNIRTSDAKSSRSSVTVVPSDFGGTPSLSLKSASSTRRATVNETHKITPQSSTTPNPYGSGFQPPPPPPQRKESQHVKFADPVKPTTIHRNITRALSCKIEDDVKNVRMDIAHRSPTYKIALRYFRAHHKGTAPMPIVSPITAPILVVPIPVSAPASVTIFPPASSDGDIYVGQGGSVGSSSLHRVRTIQKRWESLDAYLIDKSRKHTRDATASSLRPPGLEGSGDNSSSVTYHSKDGHEDTENGDIKPHLHLKTDVEQQENNRPGDGNKLPCCEYGECDGSCEDSPTERANIISLAACADPQETPELSYGKSLTAMLIEILQENKRPKLQYIMRKISDEFYHELAETVKRERDYEAHKDEVRKKHGKTPLKRRTTIEIVEKYHWDPQLSSTKPHHAEDFLDFFVDPSYPFIDMSPGGLAPLLVAAAA